MTRNFCQLLFLLLSLCLAGTGRAQSGQTVQIAVAANFAAPMQQIASGFEVSSGYHVAISVGATGKFYAQIKNAAPFDILLSADQITPSQLAQEKFAVPETQFTYATGKLVLWSATAGIADVGALLKSGRFNHIAIASPKQAPYGIAGIEALKSLNLLGQVELKIVQGESIGQTYAFAATGNAELGFVALSQVWKDGKIQSGSAWIVPQTLYSPIHQDAVLLTHGVGNPAALALIVYLKSDAAKTIMHSFGYD